MWKRRDKQLEVEDLSADRGAELSEVDLADNWRPLGLEMSLFVRHYPSKPGLSDEPLHGGDESV